MEKRFGNGTIELIQGDITKVRADALVTAANSALRGGGGVDGAIHRAAGPELLRACRAVGGCPTGSAVATPAFALGQNGVRFVIHAVGPVWHGGSRGEDELLQGAYQRSLQAAEENGCTSIAFPSISTGVYGFPTDRAGPIALDTCKQHLQSEGCRVQKIIFALFDDLTLGIFKKALEDL
jgi:O-acetyl-ADP-ribose deacetylase (regulator of RNase III)